MVDQLAGQDLDAIVIQVGGGALASACVQGFERAVALGARSRMPRIYTVQTQGAAPLARAFERAAARVSQDGIGEALGYAATHRSEFMWPWEQEPRSQNVNTLNVVEGVFFAALEKEGRFPEAIRHYEAAYRRIEFEASAQKALFRCAPISGASGFTSGPK